MAQTIEKDGPNGRPEKGNHLVLIIELQRNLRCASP